MTYKAINLLKGGSNVLRSGIIIIKIKYMCVSFFCVMKSRCSICFGKNENCDGKRKDDHSCVLIGF